MKIICKKCLLADIDRDAYTEKLMEYIAAVPEDKRVDEEEYQRRLSLCKQCDQLMNGMCAVCGCYVELRALKPVSYCPGEEKRW